MDFIHWLSGGELQYHSLWHCMKHDVPWVVATVVLDVAVAAGYAVIALHWSRNARMLPASPAKRAMATIRNIFIFCGVCGYLFIPIKLFWPAWRLYDIVMLALAFFTWRYAWASKDLKVIYNELSRTGKLARELEQSRAEVQRRSDFLNAISHDLRTPLNGLTLRTNLAEMQLADGDLTSLQQGLADIRGSALGIAEMLDELLDYARIEHDHTPPAKQVFPIAEVVNEVVRDLTPNVQGKGITLASNVDPVLLVSTDRMKLKRIITNLATNAVKFTPEGSVQVEVETASNNVILHVIDTGVGIAPEKLPLIFEEFYQVGNDQRDRRRGFGMGLPIARQLASQLGGEIQAESVVKRGSRFTVVLPEALADAKRTVSRPQAGVSHPSP